MGHSRYFDTDLFNKHIEVSSILKQKNRSAIGPCYFKHSINTSFGLKFTLYNFVTHLISWGWCLHCRLRTKRKWNPCLISIIYEYI